MWLGLSLAIGTLVSEDASTVAAGLLVGSKAMAPVTAVGWVCFGIWLGDIGLFVIGRGARRARPLAQWIDRRWRPDQIAAAAARVNRGAPAAIFASRFMPGTRLPLYVACGVLAVRPSVFAATTLAASAIWSTVIVLGVAEMGAWW